MKRVSSIAVALFALLIPALASAQPHYKMVYRPELRTMVLVPVPSTTVPITESRDEMIARHRAMAAGYRLNPNQRALANPADHCDRLVAELQKEANAQR